MEFGDAWHNWVSTGQSLCGSPTYLNAVFVTNACLNTRLGFTGTKRASYKLQI
jgi:hypothetical protein